MVERLGTIFTFPADNIALGKYAGGYTNSSLSQELYGIAIGYNAGNQDQSANSIAIGLNAGKNNQGINSLAIGTNSGANNLGDNSIHLGLGGENINIGKNSIFLNTFDFSNNLTEVDNELKIKENSIVFNSSNYKICDISKNCIIFSSSTDLSSNLFAENTVYIDAGGDKNRGRGQGGFFVNSIRKQPNWDQGVSGNAESLLSFFDSESCEVIACPIQLNDISSVNIDSLSSNHVLYFNGTEWKSGLLSDIFSVPSVTFSSTSQNFGLNIDLSGQILVSDNDNNSVAITPSGIEFNYNYNGNIISSRLFANSHRILNTDQSENLAYLNLSGGGQTGSIYTYTGNIFLASDDRLKYNETNFNNGVNLIKLLNPQRYILTASINDSSANGIESYGFIADEVQTITDLSCNVKEIADLDYANNSTNVKALNYNGILTVSIQAMKELITRIETLEAKVATLESSNNP